MLEAHAESRIFKMIRDTIVIAHGVIFPNGKCVVAWKGVFMSIVVWDSLDDMKQVNGHSNTQFVFN